MSVFDGPALCTQQWVDTANGRVRMAQAGRCFEDADWTGWDLVRASDISIGYTIRLHGWEYATVDHEVWTETGQQYITFHYGGVAPSLVWGEVLVWTYLGT